MKKQILILTFFVAAIFAGTNAFGQYTTVPTNPQCITPVPLSNCNTTAPALHPIQGVYYDYTVDQLPPNASIRWFVVNNADLGDVNLPSNAFGVDSLVSIADGILAANSPYIDAADGTTGLYLNSLTLPSTYILDVTTPALYNNDATTNGATATTATINMAWKFFNGLPPNEVLLVAYVEDATGCTDNIAVWRIIPQPAFSLDVATLSAAGDSIAPSHGTGVDVADTCVSPIEWATYSSNWGTIANNLTPGDSLRVDYGENWMFFVVNAANYLDSWWPTFRFGYSGTSVNIPAFEASWAYLDDANATTAANWHTISGTLGTAVSPFTSAAAVIAGGSAATDPITGDGTTDVGDGGVAGAAGECIVVRVRLDWGLNIEHDNAASTFRFEVDGVSYDGSTVAYGTNNTTTYFDDRAYADLADDLCDDDNWDHDWLDYIILPRPGADEGTPAQEDKSGDEQN